MGKRSRDRLYDHGTQLRQLRERTGLRCVDAAKVTSISWQTLTDIERNKIGIKLDDAKALIELYKTAGISRNKERQQNDLSIEERQKIFNENINFAYWLVNWYLRKGSNEYLSTEDLEQVALMSLWTTVCFYDFKDKEKCEFIAYARKAIKGDLVDAIYLERQSRKGLNVSVSQLLRAYKIYGMRQEGLADEKIAVELGIGLSRVKKLGEIAEMKFAEPIINTDDDGNEFDGGNEPAVNDSYEHIYADEIKTIINDAINKLPDAERSVIEQVLGFNGCEPHSIYELSKITDLSYAKAYKLYHRGMALLRHPRISEQLLSFREYAS